MAYFFSEIAGGSWESKKTSRLGVVIRISTINYYLISTIQFFKSYSILSLPNLWEDFGPNFCVALPTLSITWQRKPIPSVSLTHSLWVWLANSRVGDTMTALKPFFCGAPRQCMIGTKNAAVFPDPVGAQAKISLFFNIKGIACIWIGVGTSYPRVWIFLISSSLILNCCASSSNLEQWINKINFLKARI